METIKKNIMAIKDSSKVFFTSDTHFGHGNIIKGFSSWGFRNFCSVEEHDEYLIEQWNKTVPEDGVVFHLGDFCFASISKWEEIRNRLNGKIYLIMGNHDVRNVATGGDRINNLFEEITPQKQISINGQMIYLNHFPFLCMTGVYSYNDRPTWQLFGHVHSGPESNSQDIDRLVHLYPSQYDVGVDNNNYTPVSYEKVKNIIDKQIHDSNSKKAGLDA